VKIGLLVYTANARPQNTPRRYEITAFSRNWDAGEAGRDPWRTLKK
jgi:hypothetical protein